MEARPDMAQENYRDDEISLLDIYDFLRDGWLTLVGVSVLGLVVGVIVSFDLPTKYQASALIDSGHVGFVDVSQSVSARPIESLGVLAEKMKIPTYYSAQTVTECSSNDSQYSRQSLASNLSPNVARNSNFVSVSFESDSVATAKACLKSVLDDVVANQKSKIEAVYNYLKVEVANTVAQLDRADKAIEKQQKNWDENLALAREQLKAARLELQKFVGDAGNSRASTDALTAVQAMNKRSEVQELETMVMRLQMDFASSSDQSGQINRLTNRLTALQQAIEPPNTREAEFAAPVFASDAKVSPRRSLIIVISLLIGGFVGLMILIARRAIQAIRVHEAERKANATAKGAAS